MRPGVLVLAAPVLIAVFIWWWRARHKERPGKSLPIFLLGYAIEFTLSGLIDSARQFSRPMELGDYALFIFVSTLAGYVLGGVGWLVLGQFKEGLYDGHILGRDREKPASSDTERGLQQARQRAIEECAEEAYELVIENEAATAADHDRAERAAARLREAILALVEKGEHGS